MRVFSFFQALDSHFTWVYFSRHVRYVPATDIKSFRIIYLFDEVWKCLSPSDRYFIRDVLSIKVTDNPKNIGEEIKEDALGAMFWKPNESPRYIPGSLSFYRPQWVKLYFDANALNEYSDRAVKAVIAHELAHALLHNSSENAGSEEMSRIWENTADLKVIEWGLFEELRILEKEKGGADVSVASYLTSKEDRIKFSLNEISQDISVHNPDPNSWGVFLIALLKSLACYSEQNDDFKNMLANLRFWIYAYECSGEWNWVQLDNDYGGSELDEIIMGVEKALKNGYFGEE